MLAGSNIVPLLALATLFVYLAVHAEHLWAATRYTGSSPEALQVEVTGMQFVWTFRYPGADATFGRTASNLVDSAAGNPLGIDPDDRHGDDDLVASELVLPAGREVDLRLRALDVIHGFAIPELRLKQNALPGQTIHIHVTPTVPRNLRDPLHAALRTRPLPHERQPARARPSGLQPLARHPRASQAGDRTVTPRLATGSQQRPSALRRYIFSTDHHIIGLQYLALAMVAVGIGTVLSMLMRLHLTWPDRVLPLHGPILPEDYLALVTMHGTLMLFFVLTTAPQAGFGNLILPAQIGSRRMAFPLANALSFWITATALLTLLCATFVPGGSPISGWTAYPPLSTVAAAGPGQGAGMDLWIASIALFAIASTMSSINTLVTVVRLRCDGMTWSRLPLTVWAWFTAALLSILAFSVLLAAILLLLCDRHAGTSFFVPTGDLVNSTLHAAGHPGNGSPLLWLHLFWFFGHPEVYIAILPGMGLTSMLLANFSRRRVFGYRLMIATTLAIGLLGIIVWGHHMFVAGLNPFAGTAFSISTIAIALPSAAKVLSWLATTWRSRPSYTSAYLFSLGFRLRLSHRRPFRPDPCSAHPRPVPAQHLLRCRPFPPDHGDGRRLRAVRRHILLVPTRHRPPDVRATRPMAFLADAARRLRLLPAHAHYRSYGRTAPLRATDRFAGKRCESPARADAAAQYPHHCGRLSPCCQPNPLPAEPAAKLAARQAGPRKPMAGDHP